MAGKMVAWKAEKKVVQLVVLMVAPMVVQRVVMLVGWRDPLLVG